MKPGIRSMQEEKVLRVDEIVATVERLSRRIAERFPGAGLARVCRDVLAVSQDARQKTIDIARPILWVRALVVFLIAVIIGSLIVLLTGVRISEQELVLREFIQVLEAVLNNIVFVGALILFLITLEIRIKRRRAVKALHNLRALAHIVDMHQLTKDPERVLNPETDTASSPVRKMSAFELGRYLDYCSEILSLIGKIATVYAQSFDDAVALGAVNDIETLTNSLSRKIWQKIMMIEEPERSRKEISG